MGGYFTPIPNSRLRAHPVQRFTEAAFLFKRLRQALKLPVDQHDRHACKHMRGIRGSVRHGVVAVGWAFVNTGCDPFGVGSSF